MIKQNKIKELKRLRDLQKDSIGSEYACGLHNGLELAISVLEGREPIMETFDSEPEVIEGEEEKPGRTVFSGVRKRGV